MNLDSLHQKFLFFVKTVAPLFCGKAFQTLGMVFHMKDIRRAYRVALVVLWVSVASATTAKAQAPVNFADEKACPADLIDVPLDLIPYLNRDSAQLPINL